MPSGSIPWTFDASWGCELILRAIGDNWFEGVPDEVAVDAVAAPDPLDVLFDLPDVVPNPADDLGDVTALVLDDASREPLVVDVLTGDDAECVVWVPPCCVCAAARCAVGAAPP
jgi:hypothetical protein